MKAVVDVCGDSMVIKKILEEGEGLVTADEGATVTVKYLGKLEDGSIFEKKGFDGETPLEFVTDEEQVIPGLDRAAVTMKKGERALLTISPQYGYGEMEIKRDLATIPPSSTLVYEIEMVDFVKEKAPWELSVGEKIETAAKMKEEGNILYKSGKFQRAEKKYDKAADYISEDVAFSDDEQKQVKALRVQCWLNGAACNIKLDNFQQVIKLCSKVLDVEVNNVKALYRRAQAFMVNADLYLAELDIKKALEVDPENREVKLIYKTLKQHQAESNKRDAKFYENMFSQPAKKRKTDTEKAAVSMDVSSPVNSGDLDNMKPMPPS
ncbi:70 kDa peptidyl-prolyl isomerase-like isoform X2 [Silene latifolia]